MNIALDSAMVSRAVSSGYIKVGGKKVELSDENKKKLIETDKQAEKDRMAAFNDYVMQHELAVARQKCEAWKKAFEDTIDIYEIISKTLDGRPVESRDAQGVDWSQFEWKTYETRITVSAEDNKIEDVSEGEVVLNEGRTFKK